MTTITPDQAIKAIEEEEKIKLPVDEVPIKQIIVRFPQEFLSVKEVNVISNNPMAIVRYDYIPSTTT